MFFRYVMPSAKSSISVGRTAMVAQALMNHTRQNAAQNFRFACMLASQKSLIKRISNINAADRPGSEEKPKNDDDSTPKHEKDSEQNEWIDGATINEALEEQIKNRRWNAY